jgi:hypothetical protein
MMKPINQQRFDAMASYCRRPETFLTSEEVAWFSAFDDALLVVIIKDLIDSDYSAMALAKDLKERYRFASMTPFFDAREEAEAAAPALTAEVHANLEKERVQGDERGALVDFFTPVVRPERLNKDFATLCSSEGYSPAMEIIKPMMRWYEDADGNFVEQFQTTGFDTRLWELYIFAMLNEAGYVIGKADAIPDFVAQGLLGELCVEATSVNPSRDAQGKVVPPPPLETDVQIKAFQREYMPIRFAGPLTAKLAKQYWKRPNVEGRPLLFAIQDFHAPMSMVHSRSALPIYLYGMNWDAHYGEDQQLIITPTKVESHRWGDKVVPSGFFSLPGAEYVSAVIANPSATISKFNRIGMIAGFGSNRVRMARFGVAADFDPNVGRPRPFAHDVHDPTYGETWMEGMDIYHNPRALHPLDPDMLPGAAHHRLTEDGQVESLLPGWQPLSSVTQIWIAGD